MEIWRINEKVETPNGAGVIQGCMREDGGDVLIVRHLAATMLSEAAGKCLTYYYSSHDQASGMHEPVGTVTTRDRVGLVQALDNLTVDDLTFRMLKSHEIGVAMAFPETYVVLGTERDKVKQYGNAVTPPVEEMIVRRCMASLG